MRRALAVIPPALFLVTIVGGVTAALMSAFGALFPQYLAGLVLLWVAVLWLLGPTLLDVLLDTGHGMNWRDFTWLHDTAPTLATFFEDQCEEVDASLPRIGIIPTDVPWLFSYGAGIGQDRVIMTRGFLEGLDADQQRALLSREIGHLRRHTVPVTTSMQAVYQSLHHCTAVIDPRKHGSATRLLLSPLVFPAWIVAAAVRYALLPLLWVRTYDADRFAAARVDTTALVTGLTSLSRGMVEERDHGLLKATEPLGPQSVALGRHLGLAALNADAAEHAVETSLRRDIQSPWTVLIPFRAVHPATGRRVVRLPGIEASPAIDYDRVTSPLPADATQRFPREFAAYLLPHAILTLYPAVYLGLAAAEIVFIHVPTFLGGWIAMVGVGLTVRTIERYPPSVPETVTVTDLFHRVMPPLPTTAVRIDGWLEDPDTLTIPADTILTDGDARIPVTHRSLVPILGNISGLQRIDRLAGEDAVVTGWALDDAWPRIDLRHVETRTATVRGTVRIGKLVAGLLLAIIGAAILTLF